ncbi:MAG: polysaccharide deacetylase family protein, partial [Bacteroidales bacterium]|nr:polysaccharide deacetylase family protein [Bacteroidales bacterium]
MIIFNLPKINRITAIYFITLLFLYRFTSLPDLFFIIATVCYIFIPAYGALNICSNFYVDAVSSLPDKTAVMITFNLTKTGINLMAFLKLLDETGVKAMFFVTGQFCEENPEWIKNIHQRGHVIGNHFYDNSQRFGFYSSSRLVVNLKETGKLISGITMENVKYFRPPFGITNPFVKKAVKKLDYTVIGWKLNLNLEKSEKNRSLNRIIRKIKGGEIIVIDLSDSGNIDRIRVFIEEIKQRDLGFR